MRMTGVRGLFVQEIRLSSRRAREQGVGRFQEPVFAAAHRFGDDQVVAAGERDALVGKG
jgi:hypothetical protein